jgi:predicted MPP superfamily phosphohydrolase
LSATEKEPVLHGYLIGLLVFERLPGWLALLLLVGSAALASLLWPAAHRLWLAGLLIAFSLADWVSLAWLPRLGRSFGPVKPSLFALSGFRALIAVAVRLVWPHVWIVLAAQMALLALGVYATWIEPFRLRVTYETLYSPRLDPSLPPVRLLHIGDLHVERMTRREVKLQQLIDGLSPDLIVFSGDFVNLSYQYDPLAVEHIRRVIRGWSAPSGVYCVSGTPLVESIEDVAAFIEGSQLRWLRNEAVTIDAGGQRLAVLGVDGAQWREGALPRLHAASGGLDDERTCRVLLYHTPDVAPEAAGLGFDLQLSGHTHGGQLRLPFFGAIITASEFGKRFEMGRYEVGDMTLYVTRGIGMEGGAAPRARFLCPPEMTLWTLRGVSD